MAVPPTNQAFLREVDDELRRDQLLGFWARWGRWLIAGLVGLLLVVAGVLYWQYHRERVAGEQGEQLQQAYDALGQQQPARAAPVLDQLADHGNTGYRALAQFTQADMLLSKPDMKGAAVKFAAIAADTSVAQPFRDLATVRQTAIEFDGLKPEVAAERLRPLAVKGNPWFGSAGEMLAAAYLKEGRRDLAARLFAAVAQDEDVPPSIRQRAVQMGGLGGSASAPDGKLIP